jgi:hypothetical protein
MSQNEVIRFGFLGKSTLFIVFFGKLGINEVGRKLKTKSEKLSKGLFQYQNDKFRLQNF